MPPINILLAEDEFWTRKTLCDLLSKISEVELCAVASTIESLQNELMNYSYDLIMLDVNLNGKNVFHEIEKTTFNGLIVVVTGSKEHALDAFEFDAIDYILKPVTEERLRKTIEKVRLFQGAMQQPVQKQADITNMLISRYQLSPNEASICNAIAEGRSRKEILEIFNITRDTLKTHLRKIYSKTIDKETTDENITPSSHGKLQVLTVFLHRLKR